MTAYWRKVFTGRFAAKDFEVLFDRICRENAIDHLLTQPRRTSAIECSVPLAEEQVAVGPHQSHRSSGHPPPTRSRVVVHAARTAH